MKQLYICSLSLLFFISGFGQKKEMDFQASLTHYLSELGKKDKVDSTYLFAVVIQTDLNEKISKTKIYYYKEDSIHFQENNKLLSRFTVSHLSEYIQDRCLHKQQNQQATWVLPFVMKRVKEVMVPKKEAIFNSVDFENMIHLLQHAQKEHAILTTPIVVFMLDPYF